MNIKREKSGQLFERAESILPGGVNSPVRSFRSVEGRPFFVARGEGAYLYDVDGNRYVDYVLSWGPLVLGHADARVVAAVCEQAERGTSYGACCELEAELAETICCQMPNIEMLRFVNSGTEAAMSIIRLARGFTGKKKIVKFEGCYHGHADQLLVKAGSGVATLGIASSVGVPEEAVANTLLARFNDEGSVEALFDSFGDEIAAVIIEPVIGNSGLIPPVNDFLSFLRQIASNYGALLIFDEVMTGFRVHPGGAQALYDIKPDLTMLGKAIGGGLPVGAFGGRREIMEVLAPLGGVYQAGTLSGNPLAMAAGLATLRAWVEEGGFTAAQEGAGELVATLNKIAGQYGISFAAESVGTMFGFFFSDQKILHPDQVAQCDGERFRRFFHSMLDRGVYFAPSQYEAGFLSSVHLGEPMEHTAAAIENVFKELGA